MKTYTGASGADTAGDHTLDLPEETRMIEVRSLYVSVFGADAAADIKVALEVDGIEKWIGYIRSGAGATGVGHIKANFIELPTNGNLFKLTTSAGGGSCNVQSSITYHCSQQKIGRV